MTPQAMRDSGRGYRDAGRDAGRDSGRDSGRDAGRDRARRNDRDRDRTRDRDRDRDRDRERARDRDRDRDRDRERDKLRTQEEDTQTGPFKDFVTVKLAYERSRQRREVICASWNYLGTRIAAADNESLRIWGMRSAGEPANTIPLVVNQPHGKGICSMSWKPGSETSLATVANDQHLKIWNSVTGTVSNTYAVEHHKLNHVGYSPDAKLIACTSVVNSLIIVDPSAASVIQNIKVKSVPHSLCWSNTSDFIFVGLANGQINLYYNQGGQFELVHVLEGHNAAIRTLRVDPRGQYLYVGANEGLASVWSLESLVAVKTFGDVDEPVAAIDVTFNSTLIAIVYDGEEQPTRLFNTRTWNEETQVTRSKAGTSLPSTFQFCPNPKHQTTHLFSNPDGNIMVCYRIRPL